MASAMKTVMTGFGVYWMDIDGQRELLVLAPRAGLVGALVPLRPRPRPPSRPSLVDLRPSNRHLLCAGCL